MGNNAGKPQQKSDFLEAEAVDPDSRNAIDTAVVTNAARGWQCSVCGLEQPIEQEKCDRCRHPINKEPESEDQIIPNWNATEGGIANGEGDVEEEQFAPEGERDIEENPRPEGAAADVIENEDPDFSDTNEDEDDSDWSMEEQPVVRAFDGDDSGEKEHHEERRPSAGLNQGWICSFCGTDNPILHFECQSCSRVTTYMRDDGADLLIAGKVELTAGEKPSAGSGKKVWQCSECHRYNDYVKGSMTCTFCKHVARQAGEFVPFVMENDEYEQLVAGPRRKRSERHLQRSEQSKPKGSSMFLLDNFKHTPEVVSKHVPPTAYPVSGELAKPNQLGETFGRPRPLPCVEQKTQDYWRDGVIICPCLKSENDILHRGMAVNEHGWLAVLTTSHVRVFAPVGPFFEFACEIEFECVSFDHRIRVRYDKDVVYIFSQYLIYRFAVDTTRRTIERRDVFVDTYMERQNFRDVDVRDGFIATAWRKWIGFYRIAGCEWFHGVSTANEIQPKSLVWKRSFVHLSVGSCIVAFHCASRNPAVLWVAGNLPRSDTPFCVSDHYGVFVLVHGEVIQSYYDARAAQSICSPQCGIVTPAPRENYNPGRHVVFEGEEKIDGSPFANVEHIEFDESFGTKGRLLCWDGQSRQMMMVLNRGEFGELEMLFSECFAGLRDQVGPDLIKLLEREKQQQLQQVFDKFSAIYGARLVQWFLREVVRIHVYMSDGLVVFSGMSGDQVIDS